MSMQVGDNSQNTSTATHNTILALITCIESAVEGE